MSIIGVRTGVSQQSRFSSRTGLIWRMINAAGNAVDSNSVLATGDISSITLGHAQSEVAEAPRQHSYAFNSRANVDSGLALVPDIIGMSVEEADAAIIGAGLIVGTVTGTVAPVTLQSPEPDTVVADGTAVDYTLTS